MSVVLQQIPEILEFANKTLGTGFHPDACRWISAIDNDGKLMGVVVMTWFNQFNCELTIVSVNKRFISKALINALYKYCFIDSGLRRVTCIVDSGNHRSLDLCKRLGFIEEAVMNGHFGDNDGIVFRMKRDEYKFKV